MKPFTGKNISLFFMLCILTSFGFAGEVTAGGNMLKGKLFYTISNKIVEADIATKKQTVIYKGSDLEIFGSIGIISDKSFVVERQGIEIYDVTNASFRKMCQGEKPLYIKEINSIFYYKKDGLFQKNIATGGVELFITDNIYAYSPAIQSNVIYYPYPTIKISSSEIAYYNRNDKIEIYNFMLKSFKTIEITHFIPWAFYATTNSLICKNESDGSFYFVDIVTSEKEKINIDNPNLIKWCIIPAESINCLFYSKIRVFFMGEYEDMYIYRISQKKEQLYLKDTYIHSGAYLLE